MRKSLVLIWVILPAVLLLGAGLMLWRQSSLTQKGTAQQASRGFDTITRQQHQTAQQLLFSNPDSALVIAYTCLEKLQAENIPEQIIPFHNILGTIYLYQARYDIAMDNFYSSLDYATRSKLPQAMAQAYQNIATVNLLTYRYKEALGLLLNAREIISNLDDPIRQGLIENSIGRVYYEIGDLDMAFQYYSFAYEKFRNMDFQLGISSVSNHIGKYYLARNEADSALMYLENARKYSEQLNNHYGLSSVFHEMGNFYENLKHYDQALHYYSLSDSIANSLNFKPLNINPKLALAEVHIILGDYQAALYYLSAADTLVQQHESDQIRYKLNEVYSRFHEAQGDFAQAFHFSRLANQYKNKMISQTEVYQVYHIEVEQLNRRMEVKEMEVQEQRLLLAKRKNTTYLSLIISFLMVTGLSLIYYIHTSRLKQKEKERRHEQEVKYAREKSIAVIEAESNERKRIASELHDGIGTQLSLTKLTLSNVLERGEISPDKKNHFLEATLNTIDGVIREVKNISNSITPLALSEKDFKEAVKDLAASYSQTNHSAINLNISGLNDQMTPHAEQSLYRVIQEIVSNAAKHARCHEISIQILQDAGELTIMIEDDGIGFDPGLLQNNNGCGLRNAASRIESLDGQFLIDSAPGRGTVITMIIPSGRLY